MNLFAREFTRAAFAWKIYTGKEGTEGVDERGAPGVDGLGQIGERADFAESRLLFATARSLARSLARPSTELYLRTLPVR